MTQDEALKHLRYFSELYRDKLSFCIETFEGKRRVFTPDEIISFNLPMTLDTSHIKDDAKLWSLIHDYRNNILTVHLSARNGSKQHQPIDEFCIKIVKKLIEYHWNGNVILEYLFEFHDQLLEDLELLESIQQKII